MKQPQNLEDHIREIIEYMKKNNFDYYSTRQGNYVIRIQEAKDQTYKTEVRRKDYVN